MGSVSLLMRPAVIYGNSFGLDSTEKHVQLLKSCVTWCHVPHLFIFLGKTELAVWHDKSNSRRILESLGKTVIVLNSRGGLQDAGWLVEFAERIKGFMVVSHTALFGQVDNCGVSIIKADDNCALPEPNNQMQYSSTCAKENDVEYQILKMNQMFSEQQIKLLDMIGEVEKTLLSSARNTARGSILEKFNQSVSQLSLEDRESFLSEIKEVLDGHTDEQLSQETSNSRDEITVKNESHNDRVKHQLRLDVQKDENEEMLEIKQSDPLLHTDQSPRCGTTSATANSDDGSESDSGAASVLCDVDIEELLDEINETLRVDQNDETLRNSEQSPLKVTTGDKQNQVSILAVYLFKNETDCYFAHRELGVLKCSIDMLSTLRKVQHGYLLELRVSIEEDDKNKAESDHGTENSCSKLTNFRITMAKELPREEQTQKPYKCQPVIQSQEGNAEVFWVSGNAIVLEETAAEKRKAWNAALGIVEIQRIQKKNQFGAGKLVNFRAHISEDFAETTSKDIRIVWIAFAENVKELSEEELQSTLSQWNVESFRGFIKSVCVTESQHFLEILRENQNIQLPFNPNFVSTPRRGWESECEYTIFTYNSSILQQKSVLGGFVMNSQQSNASANINRKVAKGRTVSIFCIVLDQSLVWHRELGLIPIEFRPETLVSNLVSATVKISDEYFCSVTSISNKIVNSVEAIQRCGPNLIKVGGVALVIDVLPKLNTLILWNQFAGKILLRGIPNGMVAQIGKTVEFRAVPNKNFHEFGQHRANIPYWYCSEHHIKEAGNRINVLEQGCFQDVMVVSGQAAYVRGGQKVVSAAGEDVFCYVGLGSCQPSCYNTLHIGDKTKLLCYRGVNGKLTALARVP